MLFTDSPAITIEDLANYETGILDTAATEGINLTIKIALATSEVGLQLQSQFTPLGTTNNLPNTGLTLTNIVVTPAMEPWLIYHTLELVYRDAYFSQLNDRYQEKWNEYQNLSAAASALLFQIGVGTVLDPVPQADQPTLSLVPGTLTAAKYFVEVSWVSVSGGEGAPSETTALDVPTGDTLQVQAVNAPANAVSWNVYAGVSPDALYLQNSLPLAPGASWIAPSSSLAATGQQPGDGQQPVYLSPAPRILLRG
jgi:hypothetical protein